MLTNRHWRLNNLYRVIDKDGRSVPFRLNWAQEELLSELHYQNCILKARQLGFTTLIQLFMLDACLFNSNIRAGTIAHRLDDARVIFRDKVKFVYENLDDGIKAARPIIKADADELVFGNNSSIRVSTSMRSGTLQYLHISEYGKLCAQFPEKAREVRTGALNTVQAGQVVFLESTAEGQEGHFYELCEGAQAKARMGAPLTKLDFKFYFFPWWKAPEYRLTADGVVIEDGHARYFANLEESYGIKLTSEQKAWYVKKAETQLGDMKREYPSTPEEAFEAAIEGAYYGNALAAAETQGRIGDFPAEPTSPVYSAWDLGIGDSTAIWFFQVIAGRPRIVGYLENSGEGAPYYVAEMRKLAKAKGWTYGGCYLPHDGAVKEWGTGRSRVEQIRDAGFRVSIVPLMRVDDGINAARATIPLCTFHEADCAEGLKALKAYRKEWDENRGCWKDNPRHDWASHGADAFRYLSQCWRDPPKQYVPPEKPMLAHVAPSIEWKDGKYEGLESPMQFAMRRAKMRKAGLLGTA